MVATWIEAAARGRHGGPVRAGMWSAVVVGTHPIEADQEVWLEVSADDVPLGHLPAYWVENKGVNSFWHVPVPPLAVGTRLRYRSAARKGEVEPVYSPQQDVMVRPNLPDRTLSAELVGTAPEGLVGNRMMTVRVDSCGSTYDVYFPTVGLHSDVRPAEGDRAQSRSHFRAIVAGLAAGRRLDWFAEPRSWEVFQHYRGSTNLLVTELKWRNGPVRVLATDFVAMGPNLPRTAGGTESAGQYVKRFRVMNDGEEPRRALFGIYVQAEINGGIGEPGLSWLDGDRTLLATNRGHAHANRKLARDATVEFALALDDRSDVFCEPTGANEAILLRWLDLPAGGTVVVDVLISGAFTGWRGDHGTFEHWLRPALGWFRSADLDQVERATAGQWDTFVEALPTPDFPRTAYGVSLRRSALASALHADAKWGAIAAGFDRGLSAYCWPRNALWAALALDRLGQGPVARGLFEWLSRVRGQNRSYSYWYQKYTIDGWPEWETPAIDQTATIPFALEHHYRRTGDLEFVQTCWAMVEQAAAVCMGGSKHPGMRWLPDLCLYSSSGLWDNRFGAYLYSNTSVVAGLQAAARLADAVAKPALAARWRAMAERVWEVGILGMGAPPNGEGPGMVDPATGRFLDARRLSNLRGLWTDKPEWLVERSASIDISLLAPAVPFGLLPAADGRVRGCAEAILRQNAAYDDPNALGRWSADLSAPNARHPRDQGQWQEISSLATLWMARYLIQLGRETGDGRHWTRAVGLLDGIIDRLGPLGLALRPARQDDGLSPAAITAPGVWELHAMLEETMLDFAGLEYDATTKYVTLAPALPPSWPLIGLAQKFGCGEVAYRLDRPAGASSQRLLVRTSLTHPIHLQVQLTCPGLAELGAWHARPAAPPPAFDRSRSRLSWSLDLPAGDSVCEWAWGQAEMPHSAAEERGVGSVAG